MGKIIEAIAMVIVAIIVLLIVIALLRGLSYLAFGWPKI